MSQFTRFRAYAAQLPKEELKNMKFKFSECCTLDSKLMMSYDK